MYKEAEKISSIVGAASKIVIVQADNPDADSIGSALALEHILGDLGKQPYLYCGVDMPEYLRYMPGWDRVQKDLPGNFDASIVVDASSMVLLEHLTASGQQAWLASKPCIVLDHHAAVDHVIPFAEVMLNDPSRSSAGELIYLLAKQLNWPLSLNAQEFLVNSILGDTQGLSNQLATAETYRIMTEMVAAGVDRPKLEEQRRLFSKMPLVIFKYKSVLMARTEFVDGGRIATVTVPQDEINQYSPLYNPAPLVQLDMLQTTGVEIAIVFKCYDGGKITAAIRSNLTAPVAAQLASRFGGGGHAHASGFKITEKKPFNEVKSECLKVATELLDKLPENQNEAQHEAV